MAKATKTEVYDISIDKLYEVITDYASYPDYVDGVSAIDVLSEDETSAQVEYCLNLIKKFKYIINMKQTRPTNVSWSFDSGDIFKLNEGSWELEDLGDEGTRVTYSLEITIKGFMPGSKMIIDKLTKTNLPVMMKSIYERAKGL